MRIKNNRFRFGFIDPISIFTGLFLVATLIVSAAVVKNKNFSFNINEKASCMTTCMNQVGDQAECNFTCKESTKVADKVTAPAPKPKAETTKLCGYCKDTGTCVSCTNGGENVGECSTSNDCKKGSVNLPPTATEKPLTTTPIDNSLEKEEIQNIQQVITAPVVINGTVVNPATSVPVEKPAVVEVKSPQTVLQQPIPTSTPIVSTSSTCNNSCPSTQKCVLIGMGYYGCQNISGPNSITTYAKPDCDNNCATNQECKPLNDGYYCKTVEYVPVTPKCPSGSTWIDNTCVSNQVIQNETDTSVVNTSVQDFIASLTDRFNNVNQNTGMTDMGTYGLGGGNAYVAPVPQSVVTSTDPNAFSNYNHGSGYSFGAGVITAGTILTGSSLPAIGQSILSNSVVQSILPYYALADIADTTIATIQCGISGNPSSPECSTAVASLIAPPGAGIADDMSDAINILPNTDQIINKYGQNFFESLKNDFMQSIDRPVVIAIDPITALNAADSFNANGGFTNPNLEFPKQGLNSNTAFFDYGGNQFVVKTELPDATYAYMGDFEQRTQSGYDNLILAANQPGIGVTRPVFFKLPDGSDASISPRVIGDRLAQNEYNEILLPIDNQLKSENLFMRDLPGNFVQQEGTGINVVVDMEGVLKFQDRDELLEMMNPGVQSLMGSSSDDDFFAEWRDR